MSIELMTRAWKIPLDPTDKLVLLALADWANDHEQTCWPSVATIAKKTNVHERTVFRCLDSLEGAGLIFRMTLPGRSTKYLLKLTPAKLSGVTESQETPDTVPPKPLVNRQPSGAKAPSGRATSFPERHDFRVWCIQWAAREMHWSAEDAGSEFDSFRDSAAQHGRRYKDWEAAWRNWCRSPYCKTKPADDGLSLGKIDWQPAVPVDPKPLVLR